MMNQSFCVALLASALLSTAACNKSEPTPQQTQASTPSTPNAGAAAKEAFDTRCATCHGATGKGDGAAAAALNPKPRNYGDKAWQTSVTDEQIRKAIVQGGAAVGKSPLMPASADLDATPGLVDGLVKIIRDFGK
jgi:mono/diheme cytochrome c family protein